MSGRRRGRGEGSIVQRADGRWMARVDLRWADGKRQRKTLYGRTRRKVSDALTKALRAAQDGTLLTDERQTVGQFLARWLSDVAKPRVRPRTLDTYEAAVTHHIVPTLGKRTVAKLTPQDCQAWIATLAEQGVPLGRIRYARVVLRNALHTAIRWRLVSQNVAALVDAPRIVTREIRLLAPEQAKQLIKTAADRPLEGFVGIALGCGLRLGEALGLQWADWTSRQAPCASASSSSEAEATPSHAGRCSRNAHCSASSWRGRRATSGASHCRRPSSRSAPDCAR